MSERSRIADLIAVMARLRDPQNGCPWDLEQTHASLRSSLLEEVYEVVDAIDAADPAALAEELAEARKPQPMPD